jgi:hypothetical protein
MNPAQKVNAYLEVAEEAKDILQKTSPVKLTGFDIQLGLMDVLSIEDEYELLEQNFSCSDIVSHLTGYDFKKFHPEELANIIFEETIIPDGTERSLLEAQVKHKGEKWAIYKSDADPFPSNPHAHNYESGLKLHLGNGALYLKKKIVGQLSKKNLKLLRTKISERNIILPVLIP